MIKNKKFVKAVSASLAVVSAVQVVNMESLYASDIDFHFNNELSNTTWIVQKGSTDPYRAMIGRQGSNGKILTDTNNPDLASTNGHFYVSTPSDWDKVANLITVSNYDANKLGLQEITITYTSPSGNSMSIQVPVVVIEVLSNPAVSRTIYNRAYGSLNGSNIFTDKVNQYIVKGTQGVQLLDVYQTVSASYIRDGKEYCTLTMRSINDVNELFCNSFEVEIVDNYPPILEVQDAVAAVPLGYNAKELNTYLKATAEDFEDGDLTDHIAVGNVDNISGTEYGMKSVNLYVYDSAGLSDEKNANFSVVDIIDSLKTDKAADTIGIDEVAKGLDCSFTTEITTNSADSNVIHVTVSDTLGNVIEKDVTLIRSNEAPIITAPSSVVLIPFEASHDTVIKNINATAEDKEDGDLTDKIQYSCVDTSVVGAKKSTLEVTDSGNLTTSEVVSVSVVKIKDSITTDMNITDIKKEDVVEGLDPSFDVVIKDNGDGTIDVTVKDELGNEMNGTTEIVRCNTAPVITLKGDKTVLIPINSSMDKVKENVGATAADKEDGDLTDKIEYSDVSTVTPGAITVHLKVTDSGNLSSEEDANLSVVSIGTVLNTDKDTANVSEDDVKAIISGLVSDFTVSVSDRTDTTVKVTVTDEYGNSMSQIVTIRDNKNAPKITVTSETILIPLQATESVIKANVQATAYDKEDGDLTAKIQYSAVDTSVVGKVDTTLTVSDSDGNTDEKIAHLAVTTVKDELISNKKPSDITVDDIKDIILGGDSSFDVTVVPKDDSTVSVTIKDSLGNTITEDVKIVPYYNAGITVNKEYSLLEKDMTSPTDIILTQIGATAIDTDGSALAVTVSGLDITKVGTTQAVTLTAVGSSATYTKTVNVHIVDIVESIRANSSGYISVNTADSLVTGELSTYTITPVGTNTYHAGDTISVTVADSYGNMVSSPVRVLAAVNTSTSTNEDDSSAYFTTLKTNALVEKDQDIKQTILEQTKAVAYSKNGSKLDISISGLDTAKLGVDQVVTLKATDTDGTVITKNITVVVVDILSSIQDVDGDGYVTTKGTELVEGEKSYYVVTPKNYTTYPVGSTIPVTVTDIYGNTVSGSVYVEKATLKPSFLYDSTLALVEKDMSESEALDTILEQTSLIAKDGEGNLLATICEGEINLSKVGVVQSLSFVAVDSNKQEVTCKINYVVVDIEESIELDYGTDLTTLVAEDLVQGEHDDMKVSYVVEDQNTLQVTVVDREGNTVTDTVAVYYKNTPPTITSLDTVEVEIGTDTTQLLEALNASAYDSEDGDLTPQIVVNGYDGSVCDTTQTVLLTVMDSVGATAEKEVTVIMTSIVPEEDTPIEESTPDEKLPQTGNPLALEMQYGILGGISTIASAIVMKRAKKKMDKE